MNVTNKLLQCRPYLLRALYEWLINNQLTPNLLIDANKAGSMLSDYACNGKIVLNIAPIAVANLVLGNSEVQFDACFSGVPRHVVVPMVAVLAIYASENGTGTVFEPELVYNQQALLSCDNTDTKDNSPTPPRGGCRPLLRVVK
ncbi:Stringent starvation protein B [Candidatus Moranella endobia PCVAL]|uniref:Putative stringent starvation protein B n=1 Tax=Moranella endobia (strain PCIT) TaxID=903503 RepID=F7XXU0_MOREP|nr:ClpXP protease specificity-enhancing factor [Candidatus Moranella endobia]AEI74916.1 putative stringent starvation protein B [Candidatus Moranella endobia PCIT]AGJ61163.1 Stringent starvation protein B [Candidatus Moranella endobia PCVAL]